MQLLPLSSTTALLALSHRCPFVQTCIPWRERVNEQLPPSRLLKTFLSAASSDDLSQSTQVLRRNEETANELASQSSNSDDSSISSQSESAVDECGAEQEHDVTSEMTGKYIELLDWLQSEQVDAFVSPKVQIRPSNRGVGYGIFVSQDVLAGELLATIPRSACVTMDAALQDDETGPSLRRLIERAGPGGNTVVLAGYLAKEWLQVQHAGLDGSLFGPYLATLPWERGINEQEHVLFWTDDEIESLLDGSMCYSEAKDLRSEVDLAIRVLNGILGQQLLRFRGENLVQIDQQASGFQFPWQTKPVQQSLTETVKGLPEAVKGAFVSLLTRAFQDKDSDDSEMLVPILDIFQHGDTPNISHAKRKDDGTVEVRARCPLAAGEELLNQYRPETDQSMPYFRFFTRYGFVPGIQEPIQNLLQDKSSIFYPQKREI